MGYIKKYLRDIPSSILMIIGLAISYFVIINCADIAGKITNEYMSLNNYQYVVEYRVEYNVEKSDERQAGEECIEREHIEYFENVDCSYVAMTSFPLYLNREPTAYHASILFSYDSMAKMRNKNGMKIHYKSELVSSGECVYLGETLANYLKTKYESTNLYDEGTEYKTIDILENNSSGGIDNSLYIVWDYCTPEQRTAIINKATSEVNNISVSILLKSDIPIDDVYQKNISDFSKYPYLDFVLYEAEVMSDYQNLWYRYFSITFNVVSLIFSVMVCLVITDLWIARRRREVAIRKAFGYSNSKLFKLLFTDLLRISLPAFILAFVLQITYKLIFDERFIFGASSAIRTLAVILSILLIILLLMNRVLNKVKKISPIEWIRRV